VDHPGPDPAGAAGDVLRSDRQPIIRLLLAVPLLACARIALTRNDGLGGWAKLLE
jgi:hypothetical protein